VNPSAGLLVVALLVVGGCGGGEPPAGGGHPASTAVPTTSRPAPSDAVPVPRVVTPADDGARFTMTVGATSTLRLQDTSAPEPVASGTSVLVVPVVNVTDSGVREFELRAVSPGTSTIRGSDPDYAFTLVVR
jgi:hypothetical protein